MRAVYPIAFAVSCALLSSSSFSQEPVRSYPSKPVVMIVATAPGGPVDKEARLYSSKMVKIMGQQFIVDFKPGAGTTIGTAYVAKAAPDGYTLLVVTGSYAVIPSFYNDLPFDVVKDFAAVSLMSRRTSVVMVPRAFPAQTFVEYIAYARANPGKINIGTTGAGGVIHLAGAWMHHATKTKATFVHYKGAAPLMADLTAGRLDVAMSALVSGLQLIKSGKVRALAIMNNQRSKLLPELPTIAEQGIPEYNYASWLGFVLPGATQAGIVNKLSEGFAKVAKDRDIVEALDRDGSVLVGSTPAEFKKLIVADVAHWRKLVQETGIKLEQ